MRGMTSADHLYAMEEAANWLRVSRWSVYALINANQLRTTKIERRRLVTLDALRECAELLGKELA
jgi:excisionase family DNA binding protein